MSLFARPERRAYPAGSKFVGHDLRQELEHARMRGAWTGVSVTPDSALMIPAVWQCEMLTAGLISQLPFDQFRTAPDGQRIEVAPSPLLTNPSADVAPEDWRFQAIESAQLHGGAYGRIVAFDADLRPTQVELVHPQYVQARYRMADRTIEWKFFGQVVPPDQVWHMPGRPELGSPFGISLMDYMLEAVGVGIAGRKYGADWFRHGGAPTAVVRPARDIGQDGAERLKQKIREMLSTREPAVMPQDVLVEPWKGSTPEDAALVEMLRANSTDIANFYGVPPEFVGGDTGKSMTYSTTEHQLIQLMMFGVSYWLTKLEHAFSRALPPGEFVKANEGAVIRTDIKTRTEVLTTELRAGVRTQNEVRQLLDLPLVDDGDQLVWPPFSVTPAADPARELTEMVQKIYLGVGKVLTADEARDILNRAGADLGAGFSSEDTPA